MTLQSGYSPIPGYRLTRPLGQGGFGTVWEAMHQASGGLFAIKFIDCRGISPTLIANEIRVLLRLRQMCHPNVIRLLDVSADGQFIALRMEKADGNLHELNQVYQEEMGTTIPGDHLLDLLDQAAEALDFLAEQPRPGLVPQAGGMQHCDIKPSNLLIHNDRLKIADFGLCMASLGSTHRKKLMGTPPFAAPELYRGEITTHTDQYALAMTWCVLCMGPRALLPASPSGPALPLPIDLKKIRGAEMPVLVRAFNPLWTQRWPNCKTFVRALREALGKPRVSARKLGSRNLRRVHVPPAC